ncbi:ATP-binding protein [Paenibacillus turpanensis]|uniref:ATP-binding protein n=1 Tax=Paenibacillus turpanensis TaxID=2689078 RepID=UPI00140AEFAC|nr:ATP-binding protein [Paenibacillus turpanensis]
MDRTNRYNWTIQSTLGEEVSVLRDLASILRESPRKDDILISVAECCINAIEHGSKGQEGNKIKVSLSMNDVHYSVKVCHEGPGFDYSKAKTPHISYKLTESQPRGWGIYLMHQFSDEIQTWTDQANRFCTELRFKKGIL